MRRWFPTTLLILLAGIAIVLVPSLTKNTSSPIVDPMVVLSPSGPSSPSAPVSSATADPLSTTSASSGPLQFRQSLDQELLEKDSQSERYLVLEIEAPESLSLDRQTVHLALVMDTSGSMSSEGKLKHARMAASELLDQLQAGDTFSLVTFSDRAETVIATTGIDGVAMARRTLAGIQPKGGTNLYEGLQLGLAQLQAIERPGVRRVVLLSDGMANIGTTDSAALAREAASLVHEGVSVSGFGLGLDYSEDTLTAISDAGGGSYRFVDRPGQLSEVFATEFRQMSELVAREALLKISTPPTTQVIDIYGYSSQRNADGVQVFLGDIHAGERRKIVARVQISTGSSDTLKISAAHLSYITPAREAAAAQSFDIHASLSSRLTSNSGEATASVRPEAVRQGIEAHAAWYIEEGARAWERGDRRGSQSMMQQGEALLSEAAVTHSDPALASRAAEVRSHAQAFEQAQMGSDDGLYQVKKAKEDARAYAH